MNEFDKFKSAMEIIKAVYTPARDRFVANYRIGNFLNIQTTSSPEQDLIAIHVCLRKDGGYYFPLGDVWSRTTEDVLPLLHKLLSEYGIDIDKILLQ